MHLFQGSPEFFLVMFWAINLSSRYLQRCLNQQHILASPQSSWNLYALSPDKPLWNCRQLPTGGAKMQEFPMLSQPAGKLPDPATCPPAPATDLGRGGLNPATYSSLPCSRELHPPDTDPGRCAVEAHLPAGPGNRVLAAENSFSKEWGTN